jgi:hypothetical protein
MVGQATAAETEAVAGQQQSTKMRQRLVAAAVAAAPALVAAVTVAAVAAAVAVAAAAVVAATMAGADRSCSRHGHSPIYSRGVRPAPRGTKLASYSDISNIFGVCRFNYLRHKYNYWSDPKKAKFKEKVSK